jgi:hypothetical protein
MDGRTKLSELYIVDHNNNILNEDNEKNSNETINDIEGWVKDGIITYVIKIATTTDDTTTTRIDVDGQEQLPKYYVEELTNLGIIKDTGTKGTYFTQLIYVNLQLHLKGSCFILKEF